MASTRFTKNRSFFGKIDESATKGLKTLSNVLIHRNKIRFHNWEFGTINIRSGKEKFEGAKMYMIATEVARANLSFCALQEVRHRNTGDKIIELNSGKKYRFFWCGQKKNVGITGWAY